MFDLEKEIKNWKKSLHKNPSFEEGYIEELESHLRDLIEHKTQEGWSEEEAFYRSVNEIGDFKKINKEFSKAHSPNYDSNNSWYGKVFSAGLISNYVKIAVRSFNKNKSYSFVNIGGLAIGITVVLFVALYINYETSFDKQFKDNEKIFRVVKDFVFEDGITPDATTPEALSAALRNEIPEIEAVVKFSPIWSSKILLAYKENKFYEQNILFVDKNFFEIFNCNVVYGNIGDALEQEDGIVLTESSAIKYFGNKNPLLEIINQDVAGNKKDRVVRAVIKDFPETTHFKADFLIPLTKKESESWGNYNYYTYIKLKNNASAADIDSKIQNVFHKYVPEAKHRFYTQKLTDIHLYSNLKWELKNNGSIKQIYSFAAIALLVLVIAGINYINLATAKSTTRAKEIGLRKASGATRNLLIEQFLVESVVTALMSFVISISIIAVAISSLNILLDININLLAKESIMIILGMLGFTVLIGIVAGIYPSLYLSGFKPVEVLKGMRTSKGKIVLLRQGLVVIQFVISAVLITGALVIRQQMNFIESYNPGFDKEQIIVLPNATKLNNIEAFTDQLNRSTLIKNVAMSSGIIGKSNWTTGLRKKGAEEDVEINFQFVNYDFAKTMKMEIIEGRFFSQDFLSENENGIVISESAAKELGMRNSAVGEKIVWAELEDTTIYVNVIGVVKDFNFTSLHQEIKPFAFLFDPQRYHNVLIKVDTKNYAEVLPLIEKTWKSNFPQRPFEYLFFDDIFYQLHKSDEKFREMFNIITMIAIFIACVGLSALTAFTIERKRKEIGIRKVLGASSRTILFLLASEVLRLITVSSIIALPVSYLLIDNWLQEFAYRINLSVFTFFFAGVIVAIISLITISIQSLKAAFANPVNSLRSE